MLTASGQTVRVRPAGAGVVTVGDVLCALGDVWVDAGPACVQRAGSRSRVLCGCDGLSVVANSLRLWWTVEEDSGEGRPRPWQLAVGRW